jgi:aspartate aminotransferase
VDCVTDIGYYRRNIETLYQCLKALGFSVNPPMGTFYLWSVLPPHFSDEEAFRPLAMSGENPLLYLPGVIFGGNHYHRCVRFSACVAYEEIERACDKLRHIVSGIHPTTEAVCL